MPKGQRTFTKEFKVEAVRLVRTSGKSISQVARNLGIGDSTLHHWCQQLAEQGEQAFPGSGHQTAKARRDTPPQTRVGGDTTGT
jgi:transposase